MNTTNNRIANDIADLIRPSVLLLNGLILFLLSSCCVTSGSGSFNSSGQPHGPWTIYERFGDGTTMVLARGSLMNGQLDGAWKSYQWLTLQGTFSGGVPHGPFVVRTLGRGDGKLMDTAFDYRDGQISGTIEGYPFGDQFNIQVYVKYVVEGGEIVAVLSGQPRHARKHLAYLKDMTDMDIEFLKSEVARGVTRPINHGRPVQRLQRGQ